MDRLTASLDVYEPVANKILSVVALAFIEEREKVVRQQQEAIRELSTPVLQVRDRLLILPIIGVIDSVRAKQLTEQLLKSIRTTARRSSSSTSPGSRSSTPGSRTTSSRRSTRPG